MLCSLYVYLKASQSFLKIKYEVKWGEKEKQIQFFKASIFWIQMSFSFKENIKSNSPD